MDLSAFGFQFFRQFLVFQNKWVRNAQPSCCFAFHLCREMKALSNEFDLLFCESIEASCLIQCAF